MGEDGPEDVEVNRDWEVPLIDHPGVHEEVGNHAHHLLLESVEPCLSSVLNSGTGIFVGIDSLEESSRIAVPVITQTLGILDPAATGLPDVEIQSGSTEETGEIFLIELVGEFGKE